MIHEFRIGGWRAVVLLDRATRESAEWTVRGWTPERLEQELRALGDPYPEILLDYNCLAVQTASGWLLTDTGQSDLTDGPGHLFEALAEAKITPEDIAVIFLTHGHTDHIGGLVNPATGALNFPNARYVMSRAEWENWTSEARMAYFREVEIAFHDALRDRLIPIEPHLTFAAHGDEIVPGVTAIDATGHTIGHMALLIENGGEAVLYTGDAAVHPIHFKYLDAIYANETVPERTPVTRRALLDLAAEKNAKIFTCHFPFPGFFDVPDGWPVSG